MHSQCNIFLFHNHFSLQHLQTIGTANTMLIIKKELDKLIAACFPQPRTTSASRASRASNPVLLFFSNGDCDCSRSLSCGISASTTMNDHVKDVYISYLNRGTRGDKHFIADIMQISCYDSHGHLTITSIKFNSIKINSTQLKTSQLKSSHVKSICDDQDLKLFLSFIADLDLPLFLGPFLLPS